MRHSNDFLSSKFCLTILLLLTLNFLSCRKSWQPEVTKLRVGNSTTQIPPELYPHAMVKIYNPGHCKIPGPKERFVSLTYWEENSFTEDHKPIELRHCQMVSGFMVNNEVVISVGLTHFTNAEKVKSFVVQGGNRAVVHTINHFSEVVRHW